MIDLNPLLVFGSSLIMLAILLFLAFLDYALIGCLHDTFMEREWTECFFYLLGFCLITGVLLFLLGSLLG